MEAAGKIHFIADTKVVSDKFQSRDCVLLIADSPQYPQYVTFQFTQDKTALLDMFQAGQDVTVSFNLRGRQWTSPQGEVKFFNTLEGWKILPIAGQGTPQAPPSVPKGGVNPNDIPKTPVMNIEDLNDIDDIGGLPF